MIAVKPAPAKTADDRHRRSRADRGAVLAEEVARRDDAGRVGVAVRRLRQVLSGEAGGRRGREKSATPTSPAVCSTSAPAAAPATPNAAASCRTASSSTRRTSGASAGCRRAAPIACWRKAANCRGGTTWFPATANWCIGSACRCAAGRCRSAGLVRWSITSSLGRPDGETYLVGFGVPGRADAVHASTRQT